MNIDDDNVFRIFCHPLFGFWSELFHIPRRDVFKESKIQPWMQRSLTCSQIPTSLGSENMRKSSTTLPKNSLWSWVWPLPNNSDEFRIVTCLVGDSELNLQVATGFLGGGWHTTFGSAPMIPQQKGWQGRLVGGLVAKWEDHCTLPETNSEFTSKSFCRRWTDFWGGWPIFRVMMEYLKYGIDIVGPIPMVQKMIKRSKTGGFSMTVNSYMPHGLNLQYRY